MDILKYTLLVCFYISASFGSEIHKSDTTINQSQNDRLVIEWTATYSSENDFPKKKSITSKLLNIFFGNQKTKFVRPVAVLKYPNELLQVLDQGKCALVQIDLKTSEFKTLSPFPSLISCCANDFGDLIFTDSKLDKIFIYKRGQSKAIVLNDTLLLNRPTGIAFSSADQTIWLVETGSHRIKILDNQGKLIKHIGSRGAGSGEFNYPTYIWIDRKGIVYIVDSMNFRIQIFNRDGQFLSAFGEAGDASGYFARPKGIATDSFGNIYVADALFHTVQIFNRDGIFLNNFGSQGRGNGEFWMPTGLFIDDQDRIYVADSYNSRIQIFNINLKNNIIR